MTERGATHLKASCVVAGHLAERAWTVLNRGTPYVICDNNGAPVTAARPGRSSPRSGPCPRKSASAAAAGRWRGRPLRRPQPGRTSEATSPPPIVATKSQSRQPRHLTSPPLSARRHLRLLGPAAA